jgi:PAS domain S-box-containing protein
MTKHRKSSGREQTSLVRANFRKTERREWWLWAAAFMITALLLVGLLSFLLPGGEKHFDHQTENISPNIIRALVALVFLFDLYTIYQHLLIYRIRRQLLQREELFQLISENAADMIAAVDLNGNRLFNSMSYQKALGYSPEELAASSAYEQIHPDDRERVKKSAEAARLSGIGQTLDYRFRHKNGSCASTPWRSRKLGRGPLRSPSNCWPSAASKYSLQRSSISTRSRPTCSACFRGCSAKMSTSPCNWLETCGV